MACHCISNVLLILKKLKNYYYFYSRARGGRHMGPEVPPISIPSQFRSKFSWLNSDVYYFGFVQKITRHGREQRRILIVVRKLLLLCELSGNIKRICQLSDISRIHIINNGVEPEGRMIKFLLQYHTDPSVVCKTLTRDNKTTKIIEVLKMFCENTKIESFNRHIDYHKFPLEYGPFEKDDPYLSISDRKAMWLPNLPPKTVKRNRKDTGSTNVSNDSNTKPLKTAAPQLPVRRFADDSSSERSSLPATSFASSKSEKYSFPGWGSPAIQQLPPSRMLPPPRQHPQPRRGLHQLDLPPRKNSVEKATNNDWLSFVQYWESRAVREYSSI